VICDVRRLTAEQSWSLPRNVKRRSSRCSHLARPWRQRRTHWNRRVPFLGQSCQASRCALSTNGAELHEGNRCLLSLLSPYCLHRENLCPDDMPCQLQEDFNKKPWGEDASGCVYWLHDLGAGKGLRLCREDAPSEPQASSGKGKRSHPMADSAAGTWRTIACDIDEINEVRWLQWI
jgi:hypothetical protein